MKNTTDISKILKNAVAVIGILVLTFAMVACGSANKEDAADKEKTSASESGELTSDEETRLTSSELNSSEDTSSAENESTTLVADNTEISGDDVTTEVTTTKQSETTTKKQTSTKATTTKVSTATTSQQETTTRNEVNTRPVETHPVSDDDWWEEATTTIDYSEEETMDDGDIPSDYKEVDIYVYEKQLKDEIVFRTTYIRNFLNYSVSIYNDVYDAELTYLLMEYFETHNPHVFDLILVDDLKAENWKRICAAEIYNGAKMFDWKCITEYHNIYNNLLWDCLYNEDFSSISNIDILSIPENRQERSFEDLDGTFAYYDLKISFTSKGTKYIAWFSLSGNVFTVLDIDRVD